MKKTVFLCILIASMFMCFGCKKYKTTVRLNSVAGCLSYPAEKVVLDGVFKVVNNFKMVEAIVEKGDIGVQKKKVRQLVSRSLLDKKGKAVLTIPAKCISAIMKEAIK